MLVHALDFESESDAEVFFVAEEHIAETGQLAVDRTRFLRAADAFQSDGR